MSGVRFESAAELPGWAQKQILRKMSKNGSSDPLSHADGVPAPLDQQGEPYKEKNKYGAVRTEINGIRFDSKKEAKRFMELLPLFRAGVIEDLKLQEEFTLREAYTTPEGKRERAVRYRADFSYIRGGKKIVEDVKSKATRTGMYSMKRKLMLDRFGIEIREVI